VVKFISSTSNVISILRRNIIFYLLGCGGFIDFVCFVLACFLFDDLDIIAFKPYRPIVNII
jgi:hypothetical protein